MTTMKIYWQGSGWYVARDPAADPLEMIRIDEGDLTHVEAQSLAKSKGYTMAAFYIDPPPYMEVVSQ